MTDPTKVVTADGALPEPVYKESQIESVFQSAVNVDRTNALLINLIVALVQRSGGEVAIYPDELAEKIDGLKLVSRQEPGTKVVVLTVERAAPDEKRPNLWTPPKVGE